MQNNLLFSKDEFYDKKETKTTPGQYNPYPVSQRRKRRKSNRNFRLSFGSEQVTQVGGVFGNIKIVEFDTKNTEVFW